MKNIKIFVGATLLFIVVLFGITVAVIPLLISSNWAKNSIVSKVNSSSSAELALGDCAIGWNEGLKCTEVSYHDQGYQVDAARLTGTQGLFSLLMAPKNLGTITVDDPVVVITQPQVQSATEGETVASQTDSETSKNSEKTEDSGKKTSRSEKETDKPESWFWHKMSGKVLFNRAVVKLQQGEQEPQILLRQGALDLTLASDTLNLNLSLVTGAEQAEGQIKAIGSAHLPSVKGDLLDLMTADMQVSFTDVQLAPFLALASAESSVPQGQAILASELTVKNTEGGNLVLRGPVTLTEVDLTSGFLAEDHPRLDQLAFELHLQRDEQKEWRLPELKMLSDFGSADLQSSYGKQGLQATGKGQFDLPILLSQLPGLFKVQDNLRLENGSASLVFELAEKDKVMHINADATVEDLAGRQNRQSFVWKSPLSLSLQGSMTGKEPEVEKLALKADFLDIEGQGNLQHFTLKGSADLDKAVKEISRIIRFDWDAGGRLKLDLET
ncbi:hypothetical protein VU01_13571, partial [Candidatus Electrothrix marina]